MAAFSYRNQSKIFREITASKFQGQHAAQFNFCRYEGLCPVTDAKIHRGFSNGILQNFRTATFENNFGKLLLKKTPRSRGNRVTIMVSGFQVVSTNFRIAEPSNLDYVIHFCIPKKRLSSPVITIKF